MSILKKIALGLHALLYTAAGINHFISAEFYLNIMPEFIPAHKFMVAASGVAEILVGLGILLPQTRKLAAYGTIAMLLIFMTVHIDMVVRMAEFPDAPPAFLWARIPLQFVLIAWAWWLSKKPKAIG